MWASNVAVVLTQFELGFIINQNQKIKNKKNPQTATQILKWFNDFETSISNLKYIV